MGGISGTLSEYEGQAPLLLALPHVGKCRRTSLAATALLRWAQRQNMLVVETFISVPQMGVGDFLRVLGRLTK